MKTEPSSEYTGNKTIDLQLSATKGQISIDLKVLRHAANTKSYLLQITWNCVLLHITRFTIERRLT